MIITSTKMHMPPEPFGLEYGFSVVKTGKSVKCLYEFDFQGFKIPVNSIVKILQRTDTFIRYEITHPVVVEN